MIDSLELRKLMASFPDGFLNSEMEFIVCERTNLYFLLGDCQSELDVKCKVLEWCSRDCCKTEPFHQKKRNDEYHEMILDGVNRYLGTRFSQDDMDEIYCRLGNTVKHELTIKFIESGFDFEVLKDE